MSSKRKRTSAAATSASQETVALPGAAQQESSSSAAVADDISAELAEQIQAVRNGTFPKLVALRENLLRDLDKKVSIADRHRKLQIKNINELYESEVLETRARFERASVELQDQLIDELASEANRQRAAREQVANNGNAAGADGGDSAQVATSSTSIVERSLRSGGIGAVSEKNTIGADTATNTTSAIAPKPEKTTSSLAALLSSARRRNPTAAVSVVLEKTLAEDEMRTDFYNIVRDLETRATAFVARAYPAASSLPLVAVDGNGRLAVGNNRYCVGDMVAITSSLSGETFTGVVVVINAVEVIIRSYSGPRFSFLVGLLRSGRISIAPDSGVRDTMTTVDSASSVNISRPGLITA